LTVQVGSEVRLRVEHDTLADAVAWTARTLPKTAGTLSGILLEAADDSITLSSYDMDVSSQAVVAAVVEQPGRVLVSGRLLAEIARNLPNAPISMSADTKVKLTCGRSTFTLPMLASEEYPPLPDLPPVIGKVPGTAFSGAVSQVSIATSRNDAVPLYTGIRLEVDDDRLTMAATDRFRLAVREMPWSPEQVGISAAVVVQGRSLADATKSLAGAEVIKLALSEDARMLGIESAGRRFTTRLLDGEFHKFRSLLPTESASRVRIEVAALSSAIKRVALVTERNMAVRLLIKDGEVELSAGLGSETEAVEYVEARLDGDPLQIAFNPQFLLDGLAALDHPECEIRCTEASKPVVLTGAADSTSDRDDSYQYLLMPVRI